MHIFGFLSNSRKGGKIGSLTPSNHIWPYLINVFSSIEIILESPVRSNQENVSPQLSTYLEEIIEVHQDYIPQLFGQFALHRIYAKTFQSLKQEVGLILKQHIKNQKHKNKPWFLTS